MDMGYVFLDEWMAPMVPDDAGDGLSRGHARPVCCAPRRGLHRDRRRKQSSRLSQMRLRHEARRWPYGKVPGGKGQRQA